MISLPGLVTLLNGPTRPGTELLKRWVAEIIATIQRSGQCVLPGATSPTPTPTAAPAGACPVTELLSCVRRSEERQERMFLRLDASNRVLLETNRRIADALTGLPTEPQVPARAAPPAEPVPSAPVAAGARSAVEVLAAWRRRFEAPEDVWSVAAYIVPEILLHGELVAAGERMGARLGLTASQVHRCLGYLRRHGCIRQVGLTPGAGCPVYVFC